MYSLLFELPDNHKKQEELNKFLVLIEKEKKTIRQSLENGVAIEQKCREIDQSVWKDLVYVISGIKTIPCGNVDDWTIWSLHRESPRWGTPLFSLTADETSDELYLNLILTDDWLEEEIRQIVVFKCITPLKEFEEPFEKIMLWKGVNYWGKVRKDYLELLLEEAN